MSISILSCKGNMKKKSKFWKDPEKRTPKNTNTVVALLDNGLHAFVFYDEITDTWLYDTNYNVKPDVMFWGEIPELPTKTTVPVKSGSVSMADVLAAVMIEL